MANVNDNAPKVKGVADVVFVLDVSGSMSDVLEGVKSYMSAFVDGVVRDPQGSVKDVRLGLVIHDDNGSAGVQWFGFTSDVEEFKRNLASAPDGTTEYALPAVDTALDFPWRAKCRRYIVSFSDEPVSGGHDYAMQRGKLTEVAQKMASLHVHFIGYGPECPDYELLGATPGSTYHRTDHAQLTSADMLSVLQGIGKTVSRAVDEQVLGSAPANLYRLPAPRPR